jgi:hypothetical protein
MSFSEAMLGAIHNSKFARWSILSYLFILVPIMELCIVEGMAFIIFAASLDPPFYEVGVEICSPISLFSILCSYP